MAVTFTVTPVKTYSIGDRYELIADVACTGTPTVGGDALTAAALGLDLELDYVATSGIATVSGGTSGTAVALYHGVAGTVPVTSVTVVFYVQGTAAAGTSMVAYTGATAGFIFRVRAVGKGSIRA